jgi:hypothetical protein
VIGHFIRGLPVAGHAGHLPYLYVGSVDETLDKVTANGGAIIRPPFPEGDLWSRQSRIPPGTCLASGSGDPAADDVIRGMQNGAISSRRLMNADAVMAAPESEFRANSSHAAPTESITLREAATGATSSRHRPLADGVPHAYGLGCLRDPESRPG